MKRIHTIGILGLLSITLLTSSLPAADMGPTEINEHFSQEQKVLGNELVHVAIEGNRDRVQEILDIDPTLIAFKDSFFGQTALTYAVTAGNNTLIELLLQRGAQVDAQDNTGQTALIIAVIKNAHTVIDRLLAAGASIDIQHNLGETALMQAAYWGYEESVIKLINAGATVDKHNEQGATALMKAVDNTQPTIIKILLTAGANINAHYTDGHWKGDTALIRAAYWHKQDIVKLLLSHKADVTIRNSEGKTALEVAEERGAKVIVDLLKAHAAAPEDEDEIMVKPAVD